MQRTERRGTRGPKKLGARLRTTRRWLPNDLRKQILAAGADVVPFLIAILDDFKVEPEDEERDPDRVWPAVHAVDLLVTLRATTAIQPMLRVLCWTFSTQRVHDRILVRLPELGAAVVEPALAYVPHAEELEPLAVLLTDLGIRDDRIFEVLLRHFEDGGFYGAWCLGDYGDRRALPYLVRRMEAFRPDRYEGNLDWPVELAELMSAVRGLGGVVSDRVKRRFKRWDGEWRKQNGEKNDRRRQRKTVDEIVADLKPLLEGMRWTPR